MQFLWVMQVLWGYASTVFLEVNLALGAMELLA